MSPGLEIDFDFANLNVLSAKYCVYRGGSGRF